MRQARELTGVTTARSPSPAAPSTPPSQDSPGSPVASAGGPRVVTQEPSTDVADSQNVDGSSQAFRTQECWDHATGGQHLVLAEQTAIAAGIEPVAQVC